MGTTTDDTTAGPLSLELHGAEFSMLGTGGRTVVVRRASNRVVIGTHTHDTPIGGHDDLRDAAEQWIARQLGTDSAVNPTCNGCGTEIEVTATGPRDALIVRFDGGYGMYIDPISAEVPDALLCTSCADRLCDTNPWIRSFLDGNVE